MLAVACCLGLLFSESLPVVMIRAWGVGSINGAHYILISIIKLRVSTAWPHQPRMILLAEFVPDVRRHGAQPPNQITLQHHKCTVHSPLGPPRVPAVHRRDIRLACLGYRRYARGDDKAGLQPRQLPLASGRVSSAAQASCSDKGTAGESWKVSGAPVGRTEIGGKPQGRADSTWRTWGSSKPR